MGEAVLLPEEDLAPYEPTPSARWDRRRVAHLLRRAGFGGTREEIDEALRLGPQEAIDALIRTPGDPAYREALDGVHPLLGFDAISILQGWWALRMLSGGAPLREKMALFWHGHFATSNRKVGSLRAMHAQNLLFLERGLGRWRDLVVAIARDPAMLVWLDGNENAKGRPNENFARELMELFTLGIGHYGEDDVREGARAFTGWHERRGAFVFRASAHDGGEKRVLGRAGPLNGTDVVDACLEKDAAPRFLARKLFAFLAHPDPPGSLVDRLAARFRESGLDLADLVGAILRSRAFFSEPARRAIVKSPAEYAVGALRSVDLRGNAKEIAGAMREMGQSLFEPPNVKGWEGGRAWLSGATILARNRFAARVTAADGERYGCNFEPEIFLPSEARKSARAAADFAVETLLDGEVPEAVRERFVEAAGKGDDAGLRALVHGVLVSPEYQVN